MHSQIDEVKVTRPPIGGEAVLQNPDEASASPRGNDTRLREREFDDRAESEADVDREQVENPLARQERHASITGFEDAQEDGSDDDMDAQLLRPVALVPRRWAAPDAGPDEGAFMLALGAQLPSNGAAGNVCYVGSEKYEYMPGGGWVLVANECGRVELWERGFCAKTRKLVAFEVLLQCILADQSLHTDADEDLVDTLRVQLQISRKMYRKLHAWVSLGTGAHHGSIYDPVALLQERKLEDFDTEADFDEWFDRQLAVCTASSCWRMFWTEQESDAHSTEAANKHCVQMLQAGEELSRAIKTGEATRVSKALAALEASSPDSGPDGRTLAYPINVEVYMTLLLAMFEPAKFGGGPIAETQDIIELLGRCHSALNIRPYTMHQLALCRCCFISYLQAKHAQADATELCALLTLMADCVRQFVDEYTPENHTGESAKYEAAVLPDIVRELEEQLSDYHLHFSDVQTDSIGQVFEIFATLKFAHLVGKKASKGRKDSCRRFIKNSVRLFYRRLADALQEVADSGDEDLGMITDSIKDLAEFLAEDVFVMVIDMANQFVSFMPDAAEASLKELVKCFGIDMQQLFEDNQDVFTSVVEEVYELLHAVRVLVDASAELLDGHALDKLHSGLAQTFVPLIQNELREQRKRFDDMVNRCMANEEWVPLNPDQCVSGSTVDLFRMVGQTLPLMLDSGLLIDTDIANQYIRNVDSCVMQYSLFVSEECGSLPLMQFSQTTTVADSGEHRVHESSRLHNLEAMCVRMNSLDFATSKVEDFAFQLEPAFGTDPDAAISGDRPFAGSIEVAKKCRGEAVNIIGAHIVYRCLKTVYEALFVPTPQASRVNIILDQLNWYLDELCELGTLDEIATPMCAVVCKSNTLAVSNNIDSLESETHALFALPALGAVQEPEVFKEVLQSILQHTCNAFEDILRRGGPSRQYTTSDAFVFMEDLEALEAWFVCKDDNGKVQGLPEEVVESATLPLHILVDHGEFKAGMGMETGGGAMGQAWPSMSPTYSSRSLSTASKGGANWRKKK